MKTTEHALSDAAAHPDRLVEEIEALLARVAHLDDPRLADLRLRLQDSLRRARTSTLDAADRLRERAAAAGESADSYVRERPWTVAGLAIVAGIAVGALVARR